MPKKLIIVIILALALGGCTTGPPKADPPINDTVERYLVHCAQNDWHRALQMLTGEALIIANNNIDKNLPNMELSINSITVKNYNENGTYAIALVDAAVRQDNQHDRQFYEFDLIKLNGQWKIFSQREIVPELTGQIHSNEMPARIEQTAKSYITLATEGRWVEANDYLTGQALRAAQLNNKNIQTDTSATNIKLHPIGHQNGIWLIRASYTLSDQQLIVVMTILDLEQPRIAKIALAKGGE